LTASASSELAVSFELVSGPATLVGNEITITGAGSVSVKAIQLGNENYAAAEEVVRTFAVNKAAQIITFPELADREYKPENIGLMASASSGLPITYEVLEGPATLNGNSINIDGAGEIRIVAKQLGNDNYQEAEPVIQTFTVFKAKQSISFEAIADRTFKNEAIALHASSDAAHVMEVGFRIISGPASINGTHLVIEGAGTIEVEAFQDGNENYEAAIPVRQVFTVYKASQTITFDEIADQPSNVTSINLVASASSGLAVSFELISGPASLYGNVLSITGAGEIAVKAIQLGDSNYEAAEEVIRTFTVGKASQTITFAEISDRTYGDAPIVLQASATSGLTVNFELVSGPASVNGNELTINGVGEITVKAVQPGNDQYEAAEEVARSFTVSKAAQTITFAEIADKTYGDAAFTLEASASSELAVSFELVSGPATLTGNELSIIGTGEISVKASQLGNENYEAAEAVTRNFFVYKADQVISFEPIEDYILGGEPIELIAESDTGLEIEFEIVEGDGELNGNLLTPNAVGNFIVRAYQSGNENYNYAQATQEFTVDQATGIEDVFAEQMKMYPNPATDFVNLKFPDHDQKLIILSNASGQVIQTVDAYKDLRLNVQSLRSGIYFITIKTDQFVVTKRLMVVNK
ncbi:T9SS type A sorting domain-containing protein, partial [Marinifilum caeruleilacunae]